jgi:RNA polymerase sigma-70 factor (ECF subfamily)
VNSVARTVAPPPDPATLVRLRADLVRFFARRSGEPALAEDLAQQALVRVLDGLPRFRGEAALRTWTRRIAANLWRDRLRQMRARPAAGDGFSVDTLLDSIGAPGPGADELHDRRVTHECLLTAIRRLPADARRILLLHEFGDMPLAEAARALGCTVGTAKVRLHRARRRLAERCRAECVEEQTADGTKLCSPRPRRRT